MRSFLLFSLSLLTFIVFTQSKASSISENTQKTILIDASHGGKDPGAISKDGVYEKNLSLDYASFLKKEFDKGKLNVILTRKDDKFISLSDRVQIAENKNIDLLISIHFNFSKIHKTNGFETYYKPGCTRSMNLAKLLHSKISESGLIRDRGIKHADFYVLQNSPIPAILINIGYISNETDVKLVTNDEFKFKFANILAETLNEYF